MPLFAQRLRGPLRAFWLLLALLPACRDDDDPTTDGPTVTVSFVDTTFALAEADSLLTLTAELSASYPTELVLVVAVEGSAIEAIDYDFVGGRFFTFPPGQTRATVSIAPLNNNALDPPDRTVVLSFLDPAERNVRVGDRDRAVVRLTDDEQAGTVAANFTQPAQTVNESLRPTVTFTVALTDSLPDAVTLLLQLGGTALPNVHYLSPAVGAVTFAPGETSQTFEVPILNSNSRDQAFTLTIALRQDGPALVQPGSNGTATVEIINPTANTELWAPPIAFPQLYGYYTGDATPPPPDDRDVGKHFAFAYQDTLDPNIVGLYNPMPGSNTNALDMVRIYSDEGVSSGSANIRIPRLLRFAPAAVGAAQGTVEVIPQAVTITRSNSAGGGTFDIGLSGAGTYDEATGIADILMLFDETAIGGDSAVARRYELTRESR